MLSIIESRIFAVARCKRDDGGTCSVLVKNVSKSSTRFVTGSSFLHVKKIREIHRKQMK
jgi:2-phospho-L-lactate guanylyltransferase (CobY/MobA/RfbA family)